ncbi:DNA polymerase III subunit gamma/tau [Leptolyngbya sp. FACHB-261]|uniref:DNA polymerase III subunit gamma/tau n=1 Tax=Leptolyngbya sp. FACHB-261 TaxID=2692806 RepID=UPI00168735BC|nr:DNA polymerase III subunit gamma/tau [Leptolyngbya sp. FACHB-261]MBD2103090.1 DNA polymerase III subunit gamma/tau [Leptolyngbya sp. FACHB-261]
MKFEPLHHKYRPQVFADLVGQEAITTTLSNALRTQRIAPAYLFCGPRGTGKTSSARILARSLNCLSSQVPTTAPCGTCELCRGIAGGSALDIVEIDAASNTGVDNIRELIERAQFSPVQARYKVYIIDEVHMLSVAAFNALLKTLEEPPAQVVFVLATTDPQRVLPTIISRCQRFDFRRIRLDAMVAHLSHIARLEKIAITDEALQLVAQVAQGGLRDAESLLDQLSLLEGEITAEAVWDLVGAVPERDLLALLQAIGSDQPEAVLTSARHLLDRGREPLIVLQNLTSFYRDLLIAKTAPERRDLVVITPPTWEQLCAHAAPLSTSAILASQKHLKDSELQIKNTTQPRLWLEVTLLGLLPSALSPALADTPAPQVLTVPRAASLATSPSLQLPAPNSQSQSQSQSAVPNAATAQNPGVQAQPQPQAQPHIELPPERLPDEEEDSLPQIADPVPVQVPMQPKAQADAPLPLAVDPVAAEIREAISGNLDRHWQNFLGHPKLMRFVKGLLSKDGYLSEVSSTKAIVGVPPGLNIILSKPQHLANVREVLSAVLGYPIEVRLTIAPKLHRPESNVTALVEPAPAPVVPRVPPPFTRSPQPGPIAPSNGSSASVLSPSSSAPTSRSEAPGQAPIVSRSDDLDEVAVAAKRLAEFFNGAVVNLDSDEDSLPWYLQTSKTASEIYAEDEDEDDLPF